MNAYGHDHHARPDGHDRVLPNCQHEHVRENGHVRVRGCELSQSRGYAGGCAGVDVRVNLSLFSPVLVVWRTRLPNACVSVPLCFVIEQPILNLPH